MAQGHGVDEEQLADFGLYLGMEGYLTLGRIRDFAVREGLNPDGFDGLMAPLALACDEAADGVEDVFQLMQEKLCSLGDAVMAAAKRYGHDEDSNKSVLERTDDTSHGVYRRYLPKSMEDYFHEYPNANTTSKPRSGSDVGGGSSGGGGGSGRGYGSGGGGDSW